MRRRLIGLMRRPRRALPVVAALLLTALLAMATGDTALAQAPPAIGLVNAGRDLVERQEDGGFIARPVFGRSVAVLFYGIRDATTGDWLTGIYRVAGGETALGRGWEYAFEYPALDEQPPLDPEKSFLLVMLAAEHAGDPLQTHHAVVPVHQPDNIWDRMLAALDPERWVRAAASWAVQGVHGTLCGVVERATGTDVANCAGV